MMMTDFPVEISRMKKEIHCVSKRLFNRVKKEAHAKPNGINLNLKKKIEKDPLFL